MATANSTQDPSRLTAVVTGASSGIGRATARRLVEEGWHVLAVARREDRLEELAAETGCEVLAVDITADDSVDRLVARARELFGSGLNAVVHVAGGALGVETAAEADLEKWQRMYDINVLGTVRVTRALLPALKVAKGAVITIGSIAARQNYPGGAGYNAAKHGERALTEVLRQEIAVDGVRVTEIDPGRVHTDFSLVRFDGDADKANAVYDGVKSLTAQDVADVITFVATRPAHVNIDFLQITPIDQAGNAAPKPVK